MPVPTSKFSNNEETGGDMDLSRSQRSRHTNGQRENSRNRREEDSGIELENGSTRTRTRGARERDRVGGGGGANELDSQQAQPQQPVKLDNNLNILFNQSKDELFSLTSGYKKFQRELKNWKITTNRDDITIEKLLQHRIFVTAAPQKKFLSTEIEALKRYLNQHNGSLLIMLTEGGESKLNTNINFLLEEFGINVNNDSIIRTTYFKYFNPKEALVSDGVLNRALAEVSGKVVDSAYSGASNQADRNDHAAQSLTFVYPFGATLNVQKPAVPVLSSGTICFPIKRPLCALYGCNSSNSNNPFKKPSQGNFKNFRLLYKLPKRHSFH